MSHRIEDGLDQLDALIAELVANSAALAKATYENAEMLGELLAERRESAGAAPREPEAASTVLAPDVLEIAALHAHAAGTSLDAYLREAVLAHGEDLVGTSAKADGDLADRLLEARRASQRVRAESKAVTAHAAQAATRREKLERDSGAARSAKRRDE